VAARVGAVRTLVVPPSGVLTRIVQAKQVFPDPDYHPRYCDIQVTAGIRLRRNGQWARPDGQPKHWSHWI